MSDTLRVLGIDPGSQITGYGVVDFGRDTLSYVTSGCIRTQGDAFTERLKEIFREVAGLVGRYEPDQIAMERVFMHRNADSALKLGQARGAAICAGQQAGLEVFEYAPREIKLAVVGTGSAHKEQVNHMVCRLLALRQQLQNDESDGLAIAICHAQHQSMESKTGLPASAFNRKRGLRR